MVETRPTRERSTGAIRPDSRGGHTVPGPSRQNGSRSIFRPRIPSAALLASLIVDGVLSLPFNYRRGMYLDLLA